MHSTVFFGDCPYTLHHSASLLNGESGRSRPRGDSAPSGLVIRRRPRARRLAQTGQSKNLGWCLFYADTGSEKLKKNRAYPLYVSKKARAKRPRAHAYRQNCRQKCRLPLPCAFYAFINVTAAPVDYLARARMDLREHAADVCMRNCQGSIPQPLAVGLAFFLWGVCWARVLERLHIRAYASPQGEIVRH